MEHVIVLVAGQRRLDVDEDAFTIARIADFPDRHVRPAILFAISLFVDRL